MISNEISWWGKQCSMKNDTRYSTGKLLYTYFMLTFIKSDLFCKGQHPYPSNCSLHSMLKSFIISRKICFTKFQFLMISRYDTTNLYLCILKWSNKIYLLQCFSNDIEIYFWVLNIFEIILWSPHDAFIISLTICKKLVDFIFFHMIPTT